MFEIYSIHDDKGHCKNGHYHSHCTAGKTANVAKHNSKAGNLAYCVNIKSRLLQHLHHQRTD
jgi:hypothetical protein